MRENNMREKEKELRVRASDALLKLGQSAELMLKVGEGQLSEDVVKMLEAAAAKKQAE